MFTPSTPTVSIQLLMSIWSCSLHIPHSIIDNQQVTQTGGNAELASHFYIFCSTDYGILLHKKVTSITTTLTSKVWCTTCCYYLHPTHAINNSKYRGRGIASGMWDYAWFNLNLCFCNCSLIIFYWTVPSIYANSGIKAHKHNLKLSSMPTICQLPSQGFFASADWLVFDYWVHSHPSSQTLCRVATCTHPTPAAWKSKFSKAGAVHKLFFVYLHFVICPPQKNNLWIPPPLFDAVLLVWSLLSIL